MRPRERFRSPRCDGAVTGQLSNSACSSLLIGPTGPLLVAASPFAEIGPQEFAPQDAAAFHGDEFAGQHARDDLCVPVVLDAEAHGPGVEYLRRAGFQEVLVADEDDVAVALPLHGRVGHDDGLRLLAQDHATGAEGVRLQSARGVVERGADLDRAGLVIGLRTDPRDRPGRVLATAVRVETDLLAELDRLHILRAEIESQP